MVCQDVRVVLDGNLWIEQPFPVTIEQAQVQIARLRLYREHLQERHALQGVSEQSKLSPLIIIMLLFMGYTTITSLLFLSVSDQHFQ